MNRILNFVGTINNPEGDCRELLEGMYTSLKAKYVVGQLEKAPTTGTLHLQLMA